MDQTTSHTSAVRECPANTYYEAQRELPAYSTEQEQETLSLAKEAVSAGFIHQDVLDHLTTLHPQVPSSMKHRYLLTQLQDLEESQKELLLEYQSKPMDFPLGLEHVPGLTEHLAGYAHKWRLIGTALRFKPQDLDNIQDSHASMTESLKHNLIRLLEDWLLKKHKHTLTPTVNTLKKALSSQIVGLGDVACELPTPFNSGLPVEYPNSPYSIITMSFESQGLSIRTYSVTTEQVNTEENKPVLLEIQAPSKLGDICFKYNWCENGHQLELDQRYNYTGIKKPILCIKKPDIDMDGYEFTCKITTEHSNTETKPITLKVSCPLDMYRDSLASMYLAQPEVPEDTWPPQSNKKYINLALIKHGKTINYGEEHVCSTIRNDMDNILQHKQKIEYDEILKGFRSGQVLFVQGRPGCGKTTFVYKITQDWASTTSDGPMRLVLLVSLRVLNTLHLQKPDLDLSDILQLFHKLKVGKELLEEREGKGVCFIFDGLDEFSAPDSSIVYKIINKQYLDESIVIVASRPAAIAKLRGKADKAIEVLGFLRDQISQYFDHYPFSTHSKSAELKGYLSSHPNILHMCYLPIHAAMVAYLFEVTGEVPRTETEIYKHFTYSTLVRSLSKKVDLEDIDVYHLSGPDEILFSQICRLALEKTFLNKQVVEQDDIKNYFKTKKDRDISLGLITIDRTAGLYNYKNIYTFLHLTFQEYLAGHHISTLSYEEQNQLIQEHGHKNHMLVVWKFYCGLMKYDLKLFIAVLNNKSSLFQIQCAYESQQQISCKHLLEHTNDSLVFKDEYLTTPDLTALGYVLANASSPIALSLTECTIMSNKGIDALLSETGEKSDLLSTLKYYKTTDYFDKVHHECLNKLLLHSRCLESLDVHRIRSTIFTLKVVFNSCKMLRKLVLIEAVHSYKCQEVATEIKNCKSLEWLDISIESDAFIVKSIDFFRYFRSVTLEITKEKYLLLSCRHKDSLQELHVQHTLNSDMSRAFAVNSTNWNHLRTLELNSCFDTFSVTESTAHIVDSLKHFSELEVLKLPKNDITDREAQAILSSLKHCTALTSLDLQHNLIHTKGARVVSLCLQHWPHLQELDLSYNRIGSDVITDNLHHCTQLNLAHNRL